MSKKYKAKSEKGWKHSSIIDQFLLHSTILEKGFVTKKKRLFHLFFLWSSKIKVMQS